MITSHHNYRKYVFAIRWRPKEPVFTVDFADFPEIVTSGDRLSVAFANACEALDLHLQSFQKLGRRVPRPKHSLVVESA
jgi:predicted RNase H-like HicB family nuclease